MNSKFKTNIKCAACVEKVTPFLNNAVGEGQWSVDLQSPERVLTIQNETHPRQVEEALKQAGYKGENVSGA